VLDLWEGSPLRSNFEWEISAQLLEENEALYQVHTPAAALRPPCCSPVMPLLPPAAAWCPPAAPAALLSPSALLRCVVPLGVLLHGLRRQRPGPGLTVWVWVWVSLGVGGVPGECGHPARQRRQPEPHEPHPGPPVLVSHGGARRGLGEGGKVRHPVETP